MNEHDFFRQSIIDHLNLGKHKAVSYLPISTIVDVFKCKTSGLVGLSSDLDLAHMLTSAERSCIRSGSLHFYDSNTLSEMLGDRGWKSDFSPKKRARVFVRRIARTWFENDDPMISIIRAAFGDEQEAHCRFSSPSINLLRTIDDFIYLQMQ